jgi:hypothetical protein
MDENVMRLEVIYDTIFDNISKWGAFCSVVFTAFIFVIIRHNSNKFYKKNPNWEHFEEELDKLRDLNSK